MRTTHSGGDVQNRTTNPGRLEADDANDADGLSREALAAALPDLTNAGEQLVGWVTGKQPAGRESLAKVRPRHVLAAALGVPDEVLRAMSDRDVRRAVGRLRALVDRCDRLSGQVEVDELTGALRRGAGLAALQREIDRNRRFPGKGLVVIFIDVDGLKLVNDRDGHAAGDELLRETVAALRERLRSYDLVVRYGGDEFLCVLTDSALADAQRTAAVLCDHVQLRTGGGTISTGIADLVAGDTVDSLVERADALLYEGRHARRGTARAS